MLHYIWPIALVVLSNTFYQISAKSVPGNMDPLASLTVTYCVGAAVSLMLYFALNRNANLIAEYRRINWAPFALGLAIVGLEVGYICAFKAGWPVSTAQIVQAAILSAILIAVGRLMYGEPVTWNKALGVAVCLAGLALINYRG